ncbi:MAG TPA: O-antigen ligase family protein [Candidatus Sulfotelmatobacter sp.]|nr:O-antigen ligase family protein [Candidatus Sulfotelmatobacter sp.]
MKLSSHLIIDTTSSVDLQLVHDRGPANFQWVFVAGLCLVLFFAIFAFGAVDEWSTFALEAGAAALFLAWAAQQVLSGRLQLSQNPLYVPALGFFVLIVAQLAFRTTAYPYASKYELLQYIAYGIVLLIATECLQEEALRRKFGFTLISFGVAYAFYALAQELTSSGKFFWFYTPRFHGSIFGSYVNHDHYAGLMEMLVPFPLVIAMGRMVRGAKRVLVAFCAVLMATTVVLSGSRGGMLALAFEVIAFAALSLYQRRNARIALGTSAVCISVLGLLLFMGKGKILGRLGELGPDIRFKIGKDCLKIFLHRPLLGWGLGTFPTIYPTFRSFYTNLFVNEAHNDYAQLLVETGAVGFGLMLWFVYLLYRRGFPTSRRWEFKWDGAVSLAALLGCTALLLHSLVDFNLHVPANAAVFYALCGLAVTRPASQASKLDTSRISEYRASTGD